MSREMDKKRNLHSIIRFGVSTVSKSKKMAIPLKMALIVFTKISNMFSIRLELTSLITLGVVIILVFLLMDKPVQVNLIL